MSIERSRTRPRGTRKRHHDERRGNGFCWSPLLFYHHHIDPDRGSENATFYTSQHGEAWFPPDSSKRKAGGLAAKLDPINENIFDISERFDAPGIAKRKTDKRAQRIKALLDKLELEAAQQRQ
jgi:hypothetical protein